MVYDIFYDTEANEISFKTNGKEGNALLVLTNNTNDSQCVVWSWHLWITDTPKALMIQGTGNQANTKYYLMDRVVGATWAPTANIEQTTTMTIGGKEIAMNSTMSLENASEACGVYFQYQNRNPLPRIKSLGFKGSESKSELQNTRCAVAYGLSQYAQYWTSSAGPGGVSKDKFGNDLYIHQGIYYPNYVYEWNSTWVKANVINQFNNSAPTSSVLVSEGNYRFWNSVNNNNHDVMMNGKTAHDPCPPGYILENYSGLYWYATTRVGDYGYTRGADDETYQSGFKFYGLFYNNATDSAGNKQALYLPCAGNRAVAASISGKYGNCGYLYVVNTNNTNTYAAGDYKVGQGGTLGFGEIASGYTAPGTISGNAAKVVNHQAYPVRCRRGKY
jgi:hypothetical protein